MRPTLDYYHVLGVPVDVDSITLKKAFDACALSNHPDRLQSITDPIERKRRENEFKDASAAYRVLNDPQLRAKYDKLARSDDIFGSRSPPPWGRPSTSGRTYAPFIDVTTMDFDSLVFVSVSRNYPLDTGIAAGLRAVNIATTTEQLGRIIVASNTGFLGYEDVKSAAMDKFISIATEQDLDRLVCFSVNIYFNIYSTTSRSESRSGSRYIQLCISAGLKAVELATTTEQLFKIIAAHDGKWCGYDAVHRPAQAKLESLQACSDAAKLDRRLGGVPGADTRQKGRKFAY